MRIPYIGIDPAFRKDGFGLVIIDTDRDVRSIQFSTFLDFLSWLWADGEAPDNAICVVENSNLQKATFDMRGNKETVARKSRNVGKNQAISQCTYDALRLKYGENVFEVSPRQKGRKWSKDIFFSMLRQEGHNWLLTKPTVNQDEIDAYQLALMARKLKSFREAKIKI